MKNAATLKSIGQMSNAEIVARIAELQAIPKDRREFEEKCELRSLLRVRAAIGMGDF